MEEQQSKDPSRYLSTLNSDQRYKESAIGCQLVFSRTPLCLWGIRLPTLGVELKTTGSGEKGNSINCSCDSDVAFAALNVEHWRVVIWVYIAVRAMANKSRIPPQRGERRGHSPFVGEA